MELMEVCVRGAVLMEEGSWKTTMVMEQQRGRDPEVRAQGPWAMRE